MLTKIEALELVSEALREISPSDDSYVVVDGDTMERTFGWVFFFNSKRYLETGVFSHCLAGNGPVMVNKFTRTIEFYGTAHPIENSTAEYEAKLAAR